MACDGTLVSRFTRRFRKATESVVRNTRDVDIILSEPDLDRAIEAFGKVGFIYRRAAGVSMFLDGPGAKARDAVHILFAGKKVREAYPEPVPEIDEYALIEDARTLRLEALVRMKLTSFRDKDRVHIRDMISIDLITETWLTAIHPSCSGDCKSYSMIQTASS